MRIAIAAAVTCLSIIGMTATAQVHAAVRKRTEIPPESLDLALRTLAKDRGLQLVYITENVATLKTHGAIGEFTIDEALKKLLSDSRLEYKFVDDNTVSIFPKVTTSSLDGRRDGASTVEDDSSGSRSKRPPEGGTRVAQVGAGSPSGAVSVTNTSFGTQESADSTGLSEIIVTAQKKSERLQDVPVPVTVLDAQTLADHGQARLQDYFATVPGLAFTDAGSGRQTLAIRGIVTSDATDPTIGVTIDDVPVGNSSRLGIGQQLPADIDPSDLEHIEVLRGPQGTLYGASSMGGLIKYVTTDPSTDGLTGRVQALGSSVAHGNEGFGFRGAINVPLSDTLAVRASAFVRRDPGYIDNVMTGQNDVNRITAEGGRLAMLWHLSDTVSLKLSALLQNADADGTSTVDAQLGADGRLYPALGDLKQARIKGGEPYSIKTRLYTANLTARLGNVDFTSITGYGTINYFDRVDGTLQNGSCALNGCGAPGFSGFGVAGENDINHFDTKKFTQEFRLSSASGQVLEWLAGAFYTHESSPADQLSVAVDPATGAQVGKLIEYNFPTTLSEYALFGDLTIHAGDRFDVQVGGRGSWNRQVYNETDSGPIAGYYFGVDPFVNQTERVSGSAFTYLLTPRFKITPDMMIYARFTSGYRLGGVNVNAKLNGTPVNYAPDKTNNYELGFKGDLLAHALTVDASLYYIDWNKLQLTLEGPTGPFVVNAGRAKSQGVELSVQARPAKGLTITTAASFNDAVLKDDLPPASLTVGIAGDRLPFSSRISGSMSADQDFHITGDWTGFVGGSATYVGSRLGDFSYFYVTTPRLYFPGYARMDLRIGARHDGWVANLFLNNAANKRGITSGNTSFAESPYYAVYIQPRTLGLSVTKSFQ